jgi:S1-C subfamily serine protease
VALVGCQAAGPRVQRLPTDALKASVVYIDGCGTGWMARADFVVTNRHVAECVTRSGGVARVVFSTGDQIAGEVFATPSGRFVDLALIRLSGQVGARQLSLAAPGRLRRDDVVLSMGNPFPSRWVPASYRVVASPPELGGIIVMEGAASDGDSGSPIVTQEGQVVGVLFAKSKGHAYAIPVRPYLEDLLENIPRSPSPFRWRNGQKQ